jgi:hypothetical protein
MEQDMANDNTASDVQRVLDLMKKIGFAVLVNRDGDNRKVAL